MNESVSRGLKPSLGRVLMSGLKPGPISETTANRFVRHYLKPFLLIYLFNGLKAAANPDRQKRGWHKHQGHSVEEWPWNVLLSCCGANLLVC